MEILILMLVIGYLAGELWVHRPGPGGSNSENVNMNVNIENRKV
jgi:hypothetical protein